MATAFAENGRSVAMSELQTGDKVKTGFNVKIVLSIQTRNSKTNIMKFIELLHELIKSLWKCF